MTVRMFGLHVLVLLTLIVGAGGCQSNNSKDRDAKREADRTMMRLQEAERERAELKTQVAQLKENLDTAAKRSHDMQTELAAAQSGLKQAQDELVQSKANAASAAEMQCKLADLQAENEKMMAATKALQQQLAAAKAEAAKLPPTPAMTTPPPSTQPSLNK